MSLKDLTEIVRMPNGEIRKQQNATMTFKLTKNGLASLVGNCPELVVNVDVLHFRSACSFQFESVEIYSDEPVEFQFGVAPGLENEFIQKQTWAGTWNKFPGHIKQSLMPLQWFQVRGTFLSLGAGDAFLFINGYLRKPIP